MTREVIKYGPAVWAVEIFDPETGELRRTVFDGPDAEARARSYEAWGRSFAAGDSREVENVE